jgi:RNA recognition motif-containing protein
VYAPFVATVRQEKKVMPKRIYVGNLPFDASDDEVRDLFSEYGTVNSVNLITDRETGRPRGFGFVEMSDGADEAIEALNGKDMNGRSLNVNEARPRPERSNRRSW